MKKICLMSVLGLFLSGCSVTALLLAAPTPIPLNSSPTSTIILAPMVTVTLTPTQPTPTFTDTPTLIYANGTPTASGTPQPTETMIVFGTTTATAMPVATAASQSPLGNGLFTSIVVAGSKLFWGSCEPSSVLATVQVANANQIRWVLIFLRLKSTKTSDTTDWGGGAIMDGDKKGNFTYSLTAKNFSHYREYASAWGQYQFVALNVYKQRLGASGQYLSNLTIAPCP